VPLPSLLEWPLTARIICLDQSMLSTFKSLATSAAIFFWKSASLAASGLLECEASSWGLRMTTPVSSFFKRIGPEGSPKLARIFRSFGSPARPDDSNRAARQTTARRPRNMLCLMRFRRSSRLGGHEAHFAVEAIDEDQGDGRSRSSVGRAGPDLPGDRQDL